MSEHTPGPWMVDTETGVVVRRSSFRGVVASIHPYNRTANARLIAAAPDMLAELEDMTNVAEKAIIASGTYAEFAAIRVERARAAIAKAKGRPGDTS